MTDNDPIEEFLRSLDAHSAQSVERVQILRSVVTRFVELAEGDPDDGDLRVAATVLGEILEAAAVFAPWRNRSKLTVFGSARTAPGTALYTMAHDLAQMMAARGWITVSGAGPGIMAAAAQGAGRENTLGVNILLPFEQSSNEFIDAETRLVEMKYFFTRKVALTKESHAFAVFPGGLGTHDELFEILTLLHTGKSDPAPLVLIDTPDGSYWEQWRAFILDAVVAGGYLEASDLCLATVCHSLEEAVDEIERFHSNYVRFSVTGERGHVVLRRAPTPSELTHLAQAVPLFATGRGFEFDGDQTLSFSFDARSYVALRTLIDEVNRWPAPLVSGAQEHLGFQQASPDFG